MSGLVAILAHETGRYSEFWECVVGLDLPDRTIVKALYGADIAFGRNQLIEQARKHDMDWVWFLDDDQTWSDTQILHKLLARDVDIVQPAVLRRQLPFVPVVSRLIDGKYVPLTMEELGTTGLAAVDACGMGGTLVRRKVWETIPAPWFTVGALQPDKIGEDIALTRKATQAGLGVYVDLDNPMDHLLVARVRPQLVDGQWATSLLAGGLDIKAPATTKRGGSKPPASVLANSSTGVA